MNIGRHVMQSAVLCMLCCFTVGCANSHEFSDSAYYFDRPFYIEDCYKRRSIYDPELINCTTPAYEKECGVMGSEMPAELVCGDVITLKSFENRNEVVLGLWKSTHKKLHVFSGEDISDTEGQLKICFDDDWGEPGVIQKKILTIDSIKRLDSGTYNYCHNRVRDFLYPIQDYRVTGICRKRDVITWRIDEVSKCDDVIDFLIPPDDGQGTGSGTGF